MIVWLFSFLCAAHAIPGKIIYGSPKPIATLDPYAIGGIDSFTVMGFVVEPLARIEPKTRTLTPWLALKWTLESNGRAVRVQLRPGVKFHNGAKFTAEDVRFTWSSYFDPKYKGEAWRSFWDNVEDIQVIDDLQFKILFKKPSYQSFQNVMTALRILPRGFYEQVNHKVWNRQLVGTGAFQLEKMDSDQRLELRPNPDWWGWEVWRLKAGPSLIIKTVGDARLAEQMVRKGELDLYPLSSGQGVEVQGAKDFFDPFGSGVNIGFNLRSKAVEDIRVRRALQLGWDRKSANKKIFGGRYQLGLDSFSPETPYHPVGSAISYDPKAARDLLKKAGFVRTDGDGVLVREGPGGEERLVLRVLLHEPESERWLSLLQSDLKKIGVRLVLDRVGDEGEWLKLVTDGKFDLLVYEGALSEAPHTSVWQSSGAYNSSGLKNENVDRKFSDLETEFSSDKRSKILQELILQLRELAVEMPGLVSSHSRYLVAKDITLDPIRPLEPWRWRK